MKTYFPAVIHKDNDSDYGVSFPDFPGCVTAESTPEKAIEAADEALALHISGMIEDGERIPSPSTLSNTSKALKTNGFVAMAMVSVSIPARSRRVNVMLAEDLLDQIDAQTTNRSAFIAEAARRQLMENTAHSIKGPRGDSKEKSGEWVMRDAKSGRFAGVTAAKSMPKTAGSDNVKPLRGKRKAVKSQSSQKSNFKS